MQNTFSSFMFLFIPFRLETASSPLELVDVVIKIGNLLLKTLSLSDISNDGVSLGSLLQRISVDGSPMIEHTLRESLSSGKSSQVSSET